MGEFNSDDHYIYYCGQDTLEELEEPSQLKKKKRVQNAISKTKE